MNAKYLLFIRIGRIKLIEPTVCQGASLVKYIHAMQKTHIQSLGGEDPLQNGMATHSSVLAWRTPCKEEPGGLPSMGSQRVGHD